MNINQAFPSLYLSESDLGGQERQLKIRDVVLEDVGDGEKKPVMMFEAVDKGLVLNKTNAGTISAAFNSDETDEWKGRTVVLYPTTTQFKGKTVPCIRVRVPQASQNAANPLGATSDSIFPPDV